MYAPPMSIDTPAPESWPRMRSSHWLHRLTELGPPFAKRVFAPLMRFGVARAVGDDDAPPTLFVQIPRTAGDAIQAAVFPHLTWERSDIHSPIQCLDDAEIEALRRHRNDLAAR